MTTFVLAPDSFKESLSASEVCIAMEEGIRRLYPKAEILSYPMADGGEGTIEALINGNKGKSLKVEVSGPFLEKVKASFGLLNDGKTAVIEMAKANGVPLVPEKERNPLKTSTYGTGELIRSALDLGVKRLIIGIGGSITNDGGSGMAMALGAKFLDQNGDSIPYGGGGLEKLDRIDVSSLDPRLKEVEILVASDVTNPLTGENGASVVFGPQKGATEEMVQLLDKNLKHYAKILRRDVGIDIEFLPGSGAAGGLGGGLLAFTSARLVSGVDLVIKESGLEEAIRQADYVFTGEGKMDGQTKLGKTPYGVAKCAQKKNKPVFACVGAVGKGIEELYSEGFSAIFPIVPKAESLEEALKTGKENVTRTSENIARLLKTVEMRKDLGN